MFICLTMSFQELFICDYFVIIADLLIYQYSLIDHSIKLLFDLHQDSRNHISSKSVTLTSNRFISTWLIHNTQHPHRQATDLFFMLLVDIFESFKQCSPATLAATDGIDQSSPNSVNSINGISCFWHQCTFLYWPWIPRPTHR